MKHPVLFFLGLLLAACAPVTPIIPSATMPPATTLPPSATPTAISPSIPTPKPTRTPSPTPIPPPTVIVAGLAMRIYQVVGVPAPDPINFTTVQGGGFDYQRISALSDGGYFPDHSFFNVMSFSIWIEVGGDRLEAAEDIPNGPESASVVVTRYGHELYRISGYYPGVTMALRGFWAYDNHWVLEVGFLSKDCEWPMIGQIVEDGVVLNDKFGYEQAFGSQTIGGRPFYFFKQDGVINAWYDGQGIPLGYGEIPHYGCCSSGELNPHMWIDMVAFFGVRDETWYFVQIGMPDSFK